MRLMWLAIVIPCLWVTASGQTAPGEGVQLTGGKACAMGASSSIENLAGTVVSRDLSRNKQTPTRFVLRDKRGRRFTIKFDQEFLAGLSGEIVAGVIDLIKKGNHLWVSADHCSNRYTARSLKIKTPPRI
jgi:hypothetical protein